MSEDAFQGSEVQKAMLARGHTVYTLLSDDPRFTNYGRGMGAITGVRRGNAPSEAACNRLGLSGRGAVPHHRGPGGVAGREAHAVRP